MLSAAYIKSLGIEFIINYNRKSRQDEEHERKTGEDTLKAMRDLMDRILVPLGVPYDQEDEIGSGDKISTRPVFQQVIEDLRIGKYQAIAVKEISRMGRGSYTDMGIIYDLIIDNRIFIITPWKIYDPNNPADLRQIRFELFMSREEFETTRERLTGGRFTRALEGKWMSGKAPYGYQVNPSTTKLEIVEDDARIVRIIFDLFVNGIPDPNSDGRIDVRHRALGTYLMSQGIRTPMGKDRWRSDILQKLLTNEAYIGTMKYRQTETLADGKVVERPEEQHVTVHDAHPPIIDMEIWNKAQEKETDKNYNPRVKPGTTVYELTGLMVCNVCGMKMVRQEQKQKYISRKDGSVKIHKKEFMVCGHNRCTMVKYRLVVEQLVEALHYFRDLSESEVSTTLVPLMAEKPVSKKSAEDIEQYVERRSTELKARMKFIREKYELGKYDDEEFDESKAEIKAEQEKLKHMLTTHKKQTEVTKTVIDSEQIKKNFTSAVVAFTTATNTQSKNKILRGIFEKVYIEITVKGRGTIPSKFNIYPEIKSDFLHADFLV